MVKDPEEINHIKEAARIADNGFKYILNIIKPGITEREVARDLEYYMASQEPLVRPCHYRCFQEKI